MRTNFQGCIRDIEILKEIAPVRRWELLDMSTAIDRSYASPTWEGCPLIKKKNAQITEYHFLGNGELTISGWLGCGLYRRV